MSNVISRTNFAEWNGGSISPVIFDFDCPSYYRGLVVAVRTGGGASNPTATYGGASLTKLASLQLNTTQSRLHIFVLESPAQGSNSLVITPAGETVFSIFVASYKHVAQSGLVNASASGADGGGSGTWNVVTTVDDAWIATAVADNAFSGGNEFAPGTNLTFLSSQGKQRYGDSNASVGGTGSKSLTTTYNDTDGWQYYSLALTPTTPLPIIGEATVSEEALRSAQAAGEVIYDGEATVTERGFVISLSPLPTTADTKYLVAGTTGTFQRQLTDLAVNTTYYLRPFATTVHGTAYGAQVTFSTLNISANDIIKEIGAEDGESYAVSLTVGGTVGSVTVKLGTTGESAVFLAGSGVVTFEGIYSGADGLIITRSADFNGTVDDVLWVRVEGESTINWNLDTYTSIFPIDAKVRFKRIENAAFYSHRLYRFLDLMFKDRDGFVKVDITMERNNVASTISKTFSVGNSEEPSSAFSKRTVSFMSKNQAIIITLSNASVGETFSIAQFLLSGHNESPRLRSRGSITSI